MRILKFILIGATFALTACTTPPELYPVTPPKATQTQRIAFQMLEVRKVSLPTYASATEISLQNAEGRLVSSSGVQWADSPERAIALELALHLGTLSGAKVASEPWPLEAFPDARLDVRFESLIARADGQFRTTGQYFVSVADGGRERSGMFDLSVPFDPEAGPRAIVVARGQVILDLALYIARNGLR
ncbi:PqiC family protein [Tateyamaria pelophila]|uniref:PqiC family protein n=1 Tax=Tateyamaria pelophila TaxID=328415 RepID=UPI001CBD7EEF|nr:PqiC family protein [Tateyamaria pelophila]